MDGSLLKDCRKRIQEEYLKPLQEECMKQRQYADPLSRDRPTGEYQRDYARIMYSSAFRRLQGKMQLLGIKNDQFFRNRLTHSLEVAQIARSIAETIGYQSSELYAVEAGALAHDLGNPPFGHAGERYLNELFRDVGGFEGNAQTLRVLTSIEKKCPAFQGLNLTTRSLLAVVKYYHDYDHLCSSSQKFLYDDDFSMLQELIRKNGIKIRTLDVQIVDIADEIAYASHDLEDGLRVRAYTIEEILHECEKEIGDTSSYVEFKEQVNRIRSESGFGKNTVESAQYSKLFRQELTSWLINLAINDMGLVPVSDEQKEKTRTKNGEELGFVHHGELFHSLKSIVFKCINHNDEVYHYEQRGMQVLKFLQELYMNDTLYLPPEYRAKELMAQYDTLQEKEESKLQKRLICDYIAGMMDSFAISVYEKYSGKKFDGMNMGEKIHVNL